MSGEIVMRRKNIETSGLLEVLQHKGVAGILVLLNRGEHNSRELGKESGIAPKTISDRLQELRERGLVEIATVPGSRGASKRYKLTDKGRVLASYVEKTHRTATKSFKERLATKPFKERKQKELARTGLTWKLLLLMGAITFILVIGVFLAVSALAALFR